MHVHKTTPVRFHRPLCRHTPRIVLVAVASVIGIGLMAATSAAAPGDPVTADEAASLVAERGHQLEVLTEEFNEAREKLGAQQAAAAAAATDVVEAERQLAAVSDQLAGVAESAYAGARRIV